MKNIWSQLRANLKGSLHDDELLRILYATDASIYRELPLAVAYPMDAADLKTLIHFANAHQLSLIPRTAGTSLAGQCVGKGIVADTSRHLNGILELNVEEGWVRVQPGVIRDELNAFLKPHGLFFGPNTSTASRCMIGGMTGNNSSGTTSIKYGTTRDHVVELKTILSDGTEATFGPLSREAFFQKLEGDQLENRLYRQIYEELNQPERQQAIAEHYPKASIHRRNTGYAIDLLVQSEIFTADGAPFNFCKLLCGSEGTLAFTTEIKLQLDPLPPKAEVLVCAHFVTLDEALQATLIAMRHAPYGCELMDKFVMDCTKQNREQLKNRFFLQGDPGAILIIEFRADTQEAVSVLAENMIGDLQREGFGYAFPKVYPPDTARVWALRAAGFGVLSNVKGDAKPHEFVEDTAVALEDLPVYIAEFRELMAEFGQQAVYYAHAGAGELHLRPTVNLKTRAGVQQLREMATASARLVKKYRGSLSGEHGDGRVRGEFIPMMVGDGNYALLQRIKRTWDPQNLLNPGKIVDAPPMHESLRDIQDVPEPEIETVFDFSETEGILKLAEKCGGSGDCRKLAHVSGGVMCPSYMATRNEKDTTRARANTLREFLTRSRNGENRFAHEALYEVMDLCLSCKGCTSECPSNVDMATMKAEFLHHYYRAKGVPFRARVFGHIGRINALASKFSGLSGLVMRHAATADLLKRLLGIAPQRSLPPVQRSVRAWWQREGRLKAGANKGSNKGALYFFCDEFTDYNDSGIGIKAIELLLRLGYEVRLPDHAHSGRAQLSKGLLKSAQAMARRNVAAFKNIVSEATPLVGIEPSAILGFRDEYPKLVAPEDREAAKMLGKHALLFEEFIQREAEKGNITSDQFTLETRQVHLHGHCHQKALADVRSSAWALALPRNYQVVIIPSGCCGMAGSFGYEAEHYAVSMQIGNLVLFPAIEKLDAAAIIAAPGTSCRHQILDGTGRHALHPAEVLWEALLK